MFCIAPQVTTNPKPERSTTGMRQGSCCPVSSSITSESDHNIRCKSFLKRYIIYALKFKHSHGGAENQRTSVVGFGGGRGSVGWFAKFSNFSNHDLEAKGAIIFHRFLTPYGTACPRVDDGRTFY